MIDKNTLLEVMLEQHSIGLPTQFVAREIFETLDSVIEPPSIVIITGIRRCGKSTALQWIRQSQTEKDYYFNFDDDRLTNFALEDFQILYELLIETYGKQSKFYFDEIQNVLGWERFIRRLHDQGNKIYITGSNANMFSRELGTRLTGRYLSVTMYPYSFTEYLHATAKNLLPFKPTTENKGLIQRQFNQYLIDGGFPEHVKHHPPEYLHTLYENILYKDIIVRYKLPKEQVIRKLSHYLASNVGKNVTFNSLRKLLGLSNSNTVSEYSNYLDNSFLCFLVNNYSPSLKQQYGYVKKNYWIDSGLARQVGFRFSEDRGRMLENLVYLQLRRENKKIYYYQHQTECDFIIQEEHKITKAIQVCSSMHNEKTAQKEINGLVHALEDFKLQEGLILTENETKQLTISHNNKNFIINILPIWQWLIIK